MVRHFLTQPLPVSFMLVSMIGFLVSSLIIWKYSMTWGFTLSMIFIIWFLASVYNFAYAEGEGHLDIHRSEMHVKLRARR